MPSNEQFNESLAKQKLIMTDLLTLHRYVNKIMDTYYEKGRTKEIIDISMIVKHSLRYVILF